MELSSSSEYTQWEVKVIWSKPPGCGTFFRTADPLPSKRQLYGGKERRKTKVTGLGNKLKKEIVQFSWVQSLSRVRLFATPWIAAHQASLSITTSQSSTRLPAIESVMLSSHLILCHPLLLLPPIPPSISLFQWVNSSHEVAKGLEFQL